MQPTTTETTEPKELLIKLNKFSKGHQKLARKMGLTAFTAPVDASTEEEAIQKVREVYQALSEDEQEEQMSALVWLMTADVSKLVPRGEFQVQIADGTWKEKAFAEWEFNLTTEYLKAIPAAVEAWQA